jgi:uncharacterized DUF497 family protein
MIRLEWDAVNAKENRRKHGVSFDVAMHVFDDPDAVTNHDRIEAANGDGRRLGWSAEFCSCSSLTPSS